MSIVRFYWFGSAPCPGFIFAPAQQPGPGRRYRGERVATPKERRKSRCKDHPPRWRTSPPWKRPCGSIRANCCATRRASWAAWPTPRTRCRPPSSKHGAAGPGCGRAPTCGRFCTALPTARRWTCCAPPAGPPAACRPLPLPPTRPGTPAAGGYRGAGRAAYGRGGAAGVPHL